MKKYKQVEPGMLKSGDVVYMKVTVDYVGSSCIDVAIEDEVGVKDWSFQIPYESLLVEDNDGKEQ